MNTTLAEVIAEVRRLLGDAGGESPLYSEDLLTDGVLEALTAIMPWVSKESTLDLTGDGATSEYALPSDCYEIEAVWSEADNQFLARAGLFPGAYWLGGASSALDENLWLQHPAGKISFSTAPAYGKIMRVLYSAYWSTPAAGEDELEPPAYALPGIKYYTAAYALAPKAVSAANVRQYNTKVDSGVPTQNPMADMARFLMSRFDQEMARCPMKQRGQKSR